LAAEGYKYCGEERSWIKKESSADGYWEETEHVGAFCRMRDNGLVKIAMLGRTNGKSVHERNAP